MPNIIDIRLEDNDIAKLKRLADSKQRKAYFNEITSLHGEAIMESARKRMSDLLSPRHRFKVGASGAASENFEVRKTLNAGGMVVWSVFEKTKPKHNYFIRRGFRGTRNGKHIPRDKIKQWVIDKDITLLPSEPGDELYKKSSRLIRTKATSKRKSYIRSVKNKHVAREGIDRIIKKLEMWGSTYSNWEKLHPSGSPRFDYANYVATKDTWWHHQLAKTEKVTITAIVDYINSGRRASSGRYYSISD